MDKLNTTNGVFLDLMANDTELSQFDVFLNSAKDSQKNKKLVGYTKEYKDLIKQHTPVFEKLAQLEELILQQRAILNLTDIKVSFVRDYIYVRTPFFRRNNATKDIRVIVDRVEFWSKSTEDLMANEQFVAKAKEKLLEAMNASYTENLEKFQKLQ